MRAAILLAFLSIAHVVYSGRYIPYDSCRAPEGENAVFRNPKPGQGPSYFKVNQKAIYDCKENYADNGETVVTLICLSRGTWNRGEPKCEYVPPQNCTSAPPEGKYTIPVPSDLQGSLPGTTYTYNCSDPSYIPFPDENLPGGLTTTCLRTGEWSLNPPPSCAETCVWNGTETRSVVPGTGCLCWYAVTGNGTFDPIMCNSTETFYTSYCRCGGISATCNTP